MYMYRYWPAQSIWLVSGDSIDSTRARLAVVLSMSSIAADIDNNQILFPPPAATCVLVSSCPSNASMQP